MAMTVEAVCRMGKRQSEKAARDLAKAQRARLFDKARQEALLSGDKALILAFAKQWGIAGFTYAAMVSDHALWTVVHLARANLKSIPSAYRRESWEWLAENWESKNGKRNAQKRLTAGDI